MSINEEAYNNSVKKIMEILGTDSLPIQQYINEATYDSINTDDKNYENYICIKRKHRKDLREYSNSQIENAIQQFIHENISCGWVYISLHQRPTFFRNGLARITIHI